jgi:hypothetical protein
MAGSELGSRSSGGRTRPTLAPAPPGTVHAETEGELEGLVLIAETIPA